MSAASAGMNAETGPRRQIAPILEWEEMNIPLAGLLDRYKFKEVPQGSEYTEELLTITSR
jgi:hypothetical protein